LLVDESFLDSLDSGLHRFRVVYADGQVFEEEVNTTRARFLDHDDISDEFIEAVDVLVALGVVTGNSDGTFDPQGTFTRAMAAVIAARIYLGVDGASTLQDGTTGFRDIDGNPVWNWARPAIRWAVQQGFVSGYGDGIFGPNDPITSAQYAILMLRMLGLGENGEFTGPNWESNGIHFGTRFGILTIDGVVPSAPATREQVMQYSLNALVSEQVMYNAFLGIYYSVGTNPITGQVTTGTVTLGWRSFGLEVRETEANSMGFIQREYIIDNRVIARGSSVR